MENVFSCVHFNPIFFKLMRIKLKQDQIDLILVYNDPSLYEMTARSCPGGILCIKALAFSGHLPYNGDSRRIR